MLPATIMSMKQAFHENKHHGVKDREVDYRPADYQ